MLIEKVGVKNYCYCLRENGFRCCKNNKLLVIIRIWDNILFFIFCVLFSKFMISLSYDLWVLWFGWYYIIRFRDSFVGNVNVWI